MDNADLSPLVAARHVAATGGPLRSLDLSAVKEALRAAAARQRLVAKLLDAQAGGAWETLTDDLDTLHGAGVTLADIARAVRDAPIDD